MKLELREWKETVEGIDIDKKGLVIISESNDESRVIDNVFGSQVDDKGKVGVSLIATSHLADGYGTHYIRINNMNMQDIPEQWIKEYVDKILDIASQLPSNSAMCNALLLRAEHAMDLVKAFREKDSQ